MTNLKKENVNKCLTMLQACIDDMPAGERKGNAILALDQLHKITAGNHGEPGGTVCIGVPRGNGLGGTVCIGVPRGNGLGGTVCIGVPRGNGLGN